MNNVSGRRLEVKSHSDKILKEVEEYFKKYPALPVKAAITPAEIELKARIKYMETFIRVTK